MTARAWSSLAALLLLGLAPRARAATICVSPAGGACQTSIQDAVNLAGPGDIIRIAPGTYSGNVLVPAGKDGLQIVGASRLTTVVDAYVLGSGPGDGFNVFSNGVVIKSLGIRSAAAGIALYGQGALVTGTRIVGSVDGISSKTGGSGHRILTNEIRAIGRNAIVVTSADAVVQSNAITQAFRGIYLLEAQNPQVLTNRITGATSGIVVVDGTGSVLSGNLVDLAGTLGLDVETALPVVKGNKLTNAAAQVQCTTCAGAVLEGNSVKGSRSGGFTIIGDNAGFVARTNAVTNAGGVAFRVQGTSVDLSLNTATDSGDDDGGSGCFFLFGGNHSVTFNKSLRCRLSGFFVRADSVTLVSNTSTGAALFGFSVFGDGATHSANTLLNNRADASNGGGFAVTGDALGTSLSGNRGTKNRYDFCDDGTGTDLSAGNAFATTSTACDLSLWQ